VNCKTLRNPSSLAQRLTLRNGYTFALGRIIRLQNFCSEADELIGHRPFHV